MNTGSHKGGRRNICPTCSIDTLQHCIFYTKEGKLTRYAFLCGYVEQKGTLNLHQQHGVYHIQGFTTSGVRVWESAETLTEARKKLSALTRAHKEG